MRQLAETATLCVAVERDARAFANFRPSRGERHVTEIEFFEVIVIFSSEWVIDRRSSASCRHCAKGRPW